MTNFIPIFPLNIVVYPGENLNLHIFEPRYRQMVRECMEQKKPFGIPPVINGAPGDNGTLIEIVELAREHEGGEMDVRTRGAGIFRILEIIQEIPDKLYSGAIVTYPKNDTVAGDSTLAKNVISEVRRLFEEMDLADKFPREFSGPLSYQLGHFAGFTLEQEYEMLGLFTELQRLEYIRRHLVRRLPMAEELREMKARISRNGHFRNLSPGDVGL